MWLNVGPKYRIKSSHRIVLVGLEDLYIHRVSHVATLIVHLLSRLLASWLVHLYLLPQMFLIMFVTPLCLWIQFVLFLCFRVTPTSFSSWVLLSYQVSHRYVVTGNIHSLNAFLSSLIGTFFVLHDVVQLTECTPLLFDSPFHFLYLIMVLIHHLPDIYVSVDLFYFLSIDNNIVLVDKLVEGYFSLPQTHLRLYWLADIKDILEHFLSLWCGWLWALYHRQ